MYAVRLTDVDLVALDLLLGEMRIRGCTMRSPSGWRGYLLVLLVFVGAVVTVIGCAMLDADFLYGDWRCAFARCTKVTR